MIRDERTAGMAVPCKVGEVASGMASIEKARGHLAEAIGSLQGRLQDVLRSDTPTGIQESNKKIPCSTKLAAGLCGHAEELDLCTAEIHSILDRLEL